MLLFSIRLPVTCGNVENAKNLLSTATQGDASQERLYDEIYMQTIK